jgi:propane monooxygenase coupling protein
MTAFAADRTSSNRTGVTPMNNQVGLADALGWGDFGNDDFEEIMSSHYGRMVVLDDRVLFFANPEDAAEYLGFDLKAVG